MRLTATGVSVTLGGSRILDDVDLTCPGGELVALVGPNGAGKSTLLAALAGDLPLESGAVELDGVPVRERSARELARSRAVLPQRQTLAFGFPVREVVRMGRSPWHRTERAADDERVIDQALQRAGVDDLAARLFPTLSGGEQSRTSFARILAQQTPVLLLDEPTAALDIRHQEAVLSVAREAARAGSAVVVVLHDLSLAAAYADRVVVLSRGRLRATGPPGEVLTSGLLTEVYEHPVEVVEHRGALVVVPSREEAACVL
jgi:iron complex transport system ATP-binding protein